MKPRGRTDRKGIIAWFASNHVAANLLMGLIIFAGLYSASTIRKQTMPDFELNTAAREKTSRIQQTDRLTDRDIHED